MGRSSRNRPRSASSFESNRHFNIESIRLDPDRRSFLNLVLYVKPAFHTYLRTKSKVGCIFRKKASSQVKFTAAMSAPPLIGKAFPSDSGCRRQSSFAPTPNVNGVFSASDSQKSSIVPLTALIDRMKPSPQSVSRSAGD